MKAVLTRWAVICLFAFLLCFSSVSHSVGAQAFNPARDYQNPVLFADYSDPDVVRDGKYFYLIASSFEFVPALPILQSQDLVHWKIVGHAVSRLNMSPAYNLTGEMRYAKGVWAPTGAATTK